MPYVDFIVIKLFCYLNCFNKRFTQFKGQIDFTEFLIAISVTAQGDAKKKLSMAFKMYDMDRNGKVDKKEMEKIIEAIYDLLGEEHRKGEVCLKNFHDSMMI
jgi:Ca2+-binding EF-hand superfamily protein